LLLALVVTNVVVMLVDIALGVDPWWTGWWCSSLLALEVSSS